MRGMLSDRRFGPNEVWVPITGASGNASQDQARAAATSRGIGWSTTASVPFGFDCTGAASLQYLLRDWSGLKTFRVRNTSGITSMGGMFQYCYSLTSIPAMDTSKVTVMSFMFRGCRSLTSIPAMDTSKVTGANTMFQNCYSLTSIPAMDTSKVTSMLEIFDGCSGLTSIGIYGAKVSFSVANTSLSAAALNSLFSNLGTANAGATLTITGTPGAATCNRSLATVKGWTVTG